jgi:hypothetical protein
MINLLLSALPFALYLSNDLTPYMSLITTLGFVVMVVDVIHHW